MNKRVISGEPLKQHVLQQEKDSPLPQKKVRSWWEQNWLSLTFRSNFNLAIISIVVVGGMFLIMPEIFGLPRTGVSILSAYPVSFLVTTCLAGWGLMFINSWQLRYRSWGKYDDWIYPVWGICMALFVQMMNDMLMISYPLGAEMWGSRPFMSNIGPFSISDGNYPSTLGYALYFGGMFYVISWLKMSTPFRNKKLSFGRLMEAGIWGYILALLFFNNNSAVAFPVVLSLLMQLSSPWIDQRTVEGK